VFVLGTEMHYLLNKNNNKNPFIATTIFTLAIITTSSMASTPIASGHHCHCQYDYYYITRRRNRTITATCLARTDKSCK
jgi:hypothetical protein